MNISDLRDAPDTAGDLAAASLQRISDVSLPDISLSDVSLPDAFDDVADLAGTAVEFAGDVAGVVVKQSSRGLASAIRAARRNPRAAIGVLAIVLLVVGVVASKRGSSEPSLESIS